MITASVVVHNTPQKVFLKTVDCLLKSEIDRIFIIDNSPSGEYKNSLPTVDRIIYLKTENKGYGAANNIAITRAKIMGSEMHLVLNPDVYWTGNVIISLVKEMEANPDIGLIAPKLLYPDGSLQFSCRMLPTPADLFAKRFLPARSSKKKMKRYLLKDYNHDISINCPYLTGAFLLFRMEALKECGMFDTKFFLYPEDIDITRRIHEKYKTVYYPEVTVFHDHAQASKKNLRMFFIHLANMIKYFNKWGWRNDALRKEFNDRLYGQLRKINDARGS